jgi:hypothetical protein
MYLRYNVCVDTYKMNVKKKSKLLIILNGGTIGLYILGWVIRVVN